mmetsp:Transcript_31205/g.44299  ORF Transcript_31205/g.44299 Transcript_31205/m.44299 type:complete len:1012 (+) Transcript_31205:183-3218(+)
MSTHEDGSSDDDDFHFESENVGSKRYPVHDCCEFGDSESLRRLIFVPQDNSDDEGESGDDDDGDDSSSDDNDSLAAAHAAAIGHSPKPIMPTVKVNIGLESRENGKSTGRNVELTNAMKLQKDKDSKEENKSKGGESKGESKTMDIDKSAKRDGDGDGAGPDKVDETESARPQSAQEKVSTRPSADEKSNNNRTGTPDVESSPAVVDSAPHKKPKKKKKEKKTLYYCPFDLNERDEDENTPLHVAIHACKLEHVRLLLEAGASPLRKCDGSFSIHTAISMGAIKEHEDFAHDCVALLSGRGADLSTKDDSIHTPLYLACMMNLPRVVSFILSDSVGMSTLNARADRSGGRALHAAAKFDSQVLGGTRRSSVSAPPGGTDNSARAESAALVTQLLLAQTGIEIDAQTAQGQTALHIACSRGNWAVSRLLLQAGANASIADRRGFSPGHLAYKRGMPIPNDLLAVLGGPPPSGNIPPSRDLIVDPNSTTFLISHELCLLHRSCPPIRRDAHMDPPPENVRRLHVLVNEKNGILRSGEFGKMVWQGEARRAAMADILKCHEYNYVETISEMCGSIPDHPSAIAHLDADTAISRWSFEAAMRAAGSVCEAVDKVVNGEHRNAFCAVRPPGHHAGPRGIVRCANDPEGGSHGFCLLNNVAIGAAYARSMYRNEGIKKIAIVDFDVHHGNGTEEIIRQLVPTVEKSVVRSAFVSGELTSQRYSPWLDESDVNEIFFASTHGYGPRGLDSADMPQQGGWFYPASGKTHITDAITNASVVETPSLTDFILSQTWTRMSEESRLNCCKIINCGLGLPTGEAVPGMQRLEVRDTYRKKILPRLREFDPDIIFISAGFDAHKRDTMNFGYVGMVEDDYEWVTEQLVKVANTCCNGRVVSVLEGGYKIHGGIVSPFARSVASHVRGLVDGSRSREQYDATDNNWESQFELHILEERERKRQQRIEKQHKAMEMARKHAQEALMKEPLKDHNAGGDDEPARKRRRNQVDYRELYEAMKREGFAG